MTAQWVVPSLDPSEDRQACLGLCFPGTPVDQFALQAGKEALGHGVVIGVAHRAHGRFDPHFFTPLAIPNQSSVAKAFLEFDEEGRMKPSAYYDRVVDVMEELMKFTLLTRDVASYLVDRYSERRESAAELSKRVNQKSI